LVASLLYCLTQFMAIIQPYVFTELLHIPAGEQGRLAGNLAATQQIAVLIFVTLFGALADRFGRRLFLILAIVGMTLSMLAYPLATVVIQLYVIRFIFGMASTCNTAGGPTMRMDLTDNNSRGRFLSLMLVAQALATTLIVSYLGTRLPSWLVNRGVPAGDAGRYTFWLVGGLGAMVLAAALIGLRRDRPKTVARLSVGSQFAAVGRSMREVLAYAKVNPRFRALLIASAVLRADGAVITSFMSLWVVSAGREEGLTTPEAMRAFTTIAVVMSITDLVFGIVAGFVSDRVNRMKMLIWSVGMTAVAFSTTLFVDRVTGMAIVVVAILINLAEAFQISASQALIGEETPAHMRGSAYGMFAWIGTISVVIISFVCGYLFDKLGYKSPFLLMGLLGAAFVLITLAMLRSDAARPVSAGPPLR
jgi:MFS family permease